MDEPAAPARPAVEPIDPATCVRSTDPDKSVARLWDEALLDAIRRDFPAPTVHARNLYHTSAAMWDAWAAYDPVADGVFVNRKIASDDPAAARKKAISYAAYRVLSHRYRNAVGGAESLRQFDQLMADLCYPVKRTTTRGDSAAALGNRIARRIIAAGLQDGSREAHGYSYPKRGYRPVNKPMIVSEPGTVMRDPNRWQPLALETSITQNGQLLPVGPQEFVGQHWGQVTSFALPAADDAVPIDPGAPPRLGDPSTDAQFKSQAEEVLAFSSLLDPRDGIVIDISPASLGNSTLGTNDGTGRARNPSTGEPYAPELVPQADFGRAVAEFWADGPDSETPPGHWNTLANAITDDPAFERRIGGSGELVDPLEWDVKMYLALNGAVHDAAIAAWGAKGHYDFTRPISMIRYMGGLGQSSDATLPSYHPEGLPLIDGQVELITAESSSTRRAPRTPRRARRRDRRARLDRWTRRSLERGWWRGLDPRGRMGALSEGLLRHAGVRWLCLGPLDLQPRRGRGAGGHDRFRVLPRWPQHVDHPGGLAEVRARTRGGRGAAVGDLLRCGRPGRAEPALRRHPHQRR